MILRAELFGFKGHDLELIAGNVQLRSRARVLPDGVATVRGDRQVLKRRVEHPKVARLVPHLIFLNFSEGAPSRHHIMRTRVSGVAACGHETLPAFPSAAWSTSGYPGTPHVMACRDTVPYSLPPNRFSCRVRLGSVYER